jgi:hypothetical protein
MKNARETARQIVALLGLEGATARMAEVLIAAAIDDATKAEAEAQAAAERLFGLRA